MEKKRFIFDLDGTLMTGNFEKEKEYFEFIYGEDSQILVPNMGTYLNEYENIFSKYTIEDLSHFLHTRTDLEITPDIIDGWIEIMSDVPDVMEKGIVGVLEYLKQKDKSLAVLTNWFSKGQISRLKKAGIYEYFDDIVTGDTVLKPHRDSYLTARDQFSLDECVMIGDHLEKDYIGPRAIGMESILYDKNSIYHDNIVKIKRMNEIKKKY